MGIHRHITTTAALVASMAAAAVAAPAAMAHSGHSHAVNSAERAQLQAIEDLAADAPLATARNKCAQTVKVPGQGPSCWDADQQLWRVVQRDGTTQVSHGPDVYAADVIETNLSPTDAAAVSAASSSSVTCASNARQPRHVAIYARPASVPHRSDIPNAIRAELFKTSAFIDRQMKADDPSRTAKLRMQCTGGVVDVAEVVLPTAANADSFGSIVADIRAAGYGSATDSDGVVRYSVYYDDRVGETADNSYGLGGQAHAPSDTSPAANSQNNAASLFSVVYAWGHGTPYWTSAVHEILHNMGAVSDTAPETSGAGHCNTDWDVMCYADEGPTGAATTTVCAYTQLDCGRNTYFNGGTATGYLATNWNIASLNNRFLDFGSQNLDLTRPEKPASPTVSNITGHGATLAWAIPVDDVATTKMQVRYRRSGDPAATVVDIPAATTTLALESLAPSTPYSATVVAVDAARNQSLTPVATSFTTGADDLAPSPATVTGSTAYVGGAGLQWAAGTDNVGITEYRIEWLDAGAWTTGAIVGSMATAGSVTGLAEDSDYSLRVVALDAAGNRTASSSVSVRTLQTDTWGGGGGGTLPPPPTTSAPTPVIVKPPATPTFPQPSYDLTGPSKPGRLRVAQRTSTAHRLAWTASKDASGVSSYLVTYKVGKAKARTIRLKRTALGATIPSKIRGAYTVTVRAMDANGNAGATATLRFKR